MTVKQSPLPCSYLIRHGEAEWSLSGQHTGRTDLPLTKRGEQDARNLASRLGAVVFSCVITSPLLRARQTCELPIAQAQHCLHSTASVSILGFGHDRADEAAIVAWNTSATGWP